LHHLNRRSIAENFGHTIHDLGRVITHANNRVGTKFGGMLEHPLERIGAGFSHISEKIVISPPTSVCKPAPRVPKIDRDRTTIPRTIPRLFVTLKPGISNVVVVTSWEIMLENSLSNAPIRLVEQLDDMHDPLALAPLFYPGFQLQHAARVGGGDNLGLCEFDVPHLLLEDRHR
jgi:hypothetical protein